MIITLSVSEISLQQLPRYNYHCLISVVAVPKLLFSELSHSCLAISISSVACAFVEDLLRSTLEQNTTH